MPEEGAVVSSCEVLFLRKKNNTNDIDVHWPDKEKGFISFVCGKCKILVFYLS